ncbi:dihydrofolate reductase [Philodulcilactobacillus myokoensis]|uniref:Dihydrofolate reductase n=1 Tax=Philodulcilactobacillus myokoensis TaxID=2929573 RepID=A0A9W6ESB9_9LACO|nr:dihydrofolate reductase [Philodulcilactobacillus myokoensis]GLB46881.1 dihydrofolate reductase [Philodulcilactobacillus myokoensis]
MIAFVWAEGRNHVIGYHHHLPWHLPADMHHFKEITTGHSILAGRKTYDSFGGHPLPRRKNLVITRNPNFKVPRNVLVFHQLSSFLKYANEHKDEQIDVIGGSDIFKLILPYVDELYKTFIDADFSGDTYMPTINYHQFKLVESKKYQPDGKNHYSYRFDHFVK